MANADTILAGSTAANNITLRNDDTGSLTVLKDAAQIFKIDSAGRAALAGATLANWGAVHKGIDINSFGAIAGSGAAFGLFGNSYYDGAAYRYKNSLAATAYFLDQNGSHSWFSAGVGTAGGSFTWVQRMSLDINGNLGIGMGSDTPVAKLEVRGALAVSNNSTNYWAIDRNDSTGALEIADTSSTRLSLATNGNLTLTGKIDSKGFFVGGGASNGTGLGLVSGRTLYKILVSSNYGAGDSVRAAEYHVLTNYEGTAITSTTQTYVYNGQTATFSISGGSLIINGLNTGNTNVSVFSTAV
jgi:hypothetical protein